MPISTFLTMDELASSSLGMHNQGGVEDGREGKHREGNLARKEESFFATGTMSVAKIPAAWVRRGFLSVHVIYTEGGTKSPGRQEKGSK